MKKILCLTLLVSLLWACDTKKEPKPEPLALPAPIFVLADLQFSWRLKTGNTSSGSIVIADIFDTSNPFISGNAEAMAALCTKNGIIEFKPNFTFTQSNDCFGANSESGTYIFNADNSQLSIDFTNSAVPDRTYTVKTLTSTQLVIEIKGTSSQGFPFTTNLIHERL